MDELFGGTTEQQKQDFIHDGEKADAADAANAEAHHAEGGVTHV
jgi:hypothetical protein